MPELKSRTSGQLNWTMLVVSSLTRGVGLVPSAGESESERAGRTRAANFLATRLAWDVLVYRVSRMGDEVFTSRAWQLAQLRTGLCGGDAQLTVAVRYNIS